MQAAKTQEFLKVKIRYQWHTTRQHLKAFAGDRKTTFQTKKMISEIDYRDYNSIS